MTVLVEHGSRQAGVVLKQCLRAYILMYKHQTDRQTDSEEEGGGEGGRKRNRERQRTPRPYFRSMTMPLHVTF